MEKWSFFFFFLHVSRMANFKFLGRKGANDNILPTHPTLLYLPSTPTHPTLHYFIVFVCFQM